MGRLHCLILRLLVLLLVLAGAAIATAKGPVSVRGYHRKDGTYVQPHTRSAPGTGSHSGSTYTAPQTYAVADPVDVTAGASTPKTKTHRTATYDNAVQPATGESLNGKIVRVVDGDTLVMLVEKTQYKIRLAGIDAPESGQAFGTQSKKALSAKVFGKTLRVVSKGQDRYGRTLGIVYDEENHCVNTQMVKEGFAWHYTQYSESKALTKAEETARDAKAGLWADAHPVAPWDWRHNGKDIQETPFTEAESTVSSNETQKANAEEQYWLTIASGIRHNSHCRYYHNSKGRPCGPNDGRACKICGG